MAAEQKKTDDVETLLSDLKAIEDRKQALIEDLLREREAFNAEIDEKLATLGYRAASVKTKRSHHKKAAGGHAQRATDDLFDLEPQKKIAAARTAAALTISHKAKALTSFARLLILGFRFLRGRAKDRALVFLQDAAPMPEISGMVFPDLRRNAEVGAQERGFQLGNQFLVPRPVSGKPDAGAARIQVRQ